MARTFKFDKLALKDAFWENPEQIAPAGHLKLFDIPLKGCSKSIHNATEANDVILSKYGGTVVLTGMTVLTSRYSGALAIDRLCVCMVSLAHLS